MKWFQVLECDNAVKNPLVCDSTNLSEFGFTENDFRTGDRISTWNRNIFFKAEEKTDDGDPDDALLNCFMLPIYSERLVHALTDEGIDGIQYLPVSILRPTNERLDGFQLANITNFAKAFNFEKSVYNRFRDDFPNPNVRGKIAGVMKFVLNGNQLEGMDIIRLAEYKRRFFVSEKFKKIFEGNHFTGYSFIRVELE